MANIRVLMVDDDKEYCSSFVKHAYKNYKIQVVPKSSLDEMIDFLRHQRSTLDAIILDVICNKTSTQAMPASDFLIAALDELKQHCRYVPRFILSADADGMKLRKLDHMSEKFFCKGDDGDRDRLLKEILQAAENSEVNQVKTEFSDMVDICENLLSEEFQNKLLSLLLTRNSIEISEIEANLGRVRKILEEIFKIIIKKDCIPESYLDEYAKIGKETVPLHAGDHVHVRALIRYLGGFWRGKWVCVKDHSFHGVIQKESEMLYGIASDYSAHDTSSKFKPSENTIQSAIFALRDVMTWFDLRMRGVLTPEK